jgi:hypothetical protein
MRPGRKIFAGTCGLALLASGALAAPVNDERILSPAELVALEREDGMWRVLQVDEELPVCLARLRTAGYSAEEIDAFQPRLAAIWEPTADRNYGWLQEEVVVRIKAVDREFIARMRAVRLWETAGLRPKDFSRENEQTVNRLWRQAILRVLDYDELAEFRLMNSAAAREAGRLLQGIELTADEQRVLFMGERDFARDYGAAPFEAWGADWKELVAAQLDHFAAVREVLGSERFAVYLERAAPDFAPLREALGGTPSVSAGAAVDLWWLRKQRDLAAAKKGFMTAREWQATVANLRSAAAKVLGQDKFAAYVQRDDARWLR